MEFDSQNTKQNSPNLILVQPKTTIKTTKKSKTNINEPKSIKHSQKFIKTMFVQENIELYQIKFIEGNIKLLKICCFL